MGKRELLLIVAFVVMGTVVYQFMAPPPGPGERGLGVGKLIDNVRREIRGNRASADQTRTMAQPIDTAQTELRLTDMASVEITIVGEDRRDVQAEFQVHSNGYDQAEAERLATESSLTFDPAGASLIARVRFPEAGRQRAKLSLKIPARMTVRLDPTSGKLTIEKVAAVDLAGARGDTKITGIAGRVTATQNGGELVIAEAGAARITSRGTDVRLDTVAGEATLNVRGGELHVAGVAGALELESNNTDVVLDTLTVTGTVRVNATNGTVRVTGLRTEGRIDARHAEIDVTLDRAAPLAIYNDGEAVEVTPPAAGYKLDAVATGGHLSVGDGGPAVETATAGNDEQRAVGVVRGGGPTITIRAKNGDVTVRAREAAKPDTTTVKPERDEK